MSAVLERVDPRVALSRIHAVLDELRAAELTGLGEEEFLDYGRELERVRRRLPTLDHAFVLEVEGRDLPGASFLRSTGQFLRALLRLDPGEAAGRGPGWPR